MKNSIKKARKLDNTELKAFIGSTLDGIKENLKDGVKLTTPIDFDVAITVTKEGGMKISQIGGKIEKEIVSRVKFSLFPRTKKDKMP